MSSYDSFCKKPKMYAAFFLLLIFLCVSYLGVYHDSEFLSFLRVIKEEREFIIIGCFIPAFLSINFILIFFVEMLIMFIFQFYSYRNESFIGEIKSPKLRSFFLYLLFCTAAISGFFTLFMPLGFLFPSRLIADSLGYPIHCSDDFYAPYKSHRKKYTGQGYMIWNDRYARTLGDCPQYYYTSNNLERQKETLQDQDQFYQEMSHE